MTAFPPIWLAAAASLGYFHPDLPLITAAMATFNSLYSFMVRTCVWTSLFIVFSAIRLFILDIFPDSLIFLFSCNLLIFKIAIFLNSFCNLFVSSLFSLFDFRYFQWDVSMDWGLFTITRNGSVNWRQVRVLSLILLEMKHYSYHDYIIIVFFLIYFYYYYR